MLCSLQPWEATHSEMEQGLGQVVWTHVHTSPWGHWQGLLAQQPA